MTARARRLGLLLAWLAALVLLAWYCITGIRISTDLRSFMPPAQTADQQLLMEQIGEGPGSRLLMLAIGGGEMDRLAQLSRELLRTLRADAHFSQVINGEFNADMLDPQWLPYRYLLTSSFDAQPLDEAVLADQLQQRVEDLGSPAATLLKPLLPRDPTLEVLALAEQWSPPKSPQVRDGVWFSPENEALLLVQTRAAGFDPAAQGEAIEELESAFDSITRSNDQAKLTIRGTG